MLNNCYTEDNYYITTYFTGGRLDNQYFQIATILSLSYDISKIFKIKCKPVFPHLKDKNNWVSQPKKWDGIHIDLWGVKPEEVFYNKYQHNKKGPYKNIDISDNLECHKYLMIHEKDRINKTTRQFAVYIGKLLLKSPNKRVILLPMAPYSYFKLIFIKKRSKNFGMPGYQYYKLWHHNYDLVKKHLLPNTIIKNKLKSKFNKIIKTKFPDFNWNDDNCSLHLRRGDRQNYFSKGGFLFPIYGTKQYYQKAIKKMERLVKGVKYYIIFTENSSWADNFIKTNLGDIYDKIFIMDWKLYKQTDFEDLYLMSYIKNNIIINSSFSWWGAYLNENPNKKIITTKKWANFTKIIGDSRYINIIPKNWYIIENKMTKKNILVKYN